MIEPDEDVIELLVDGDVFFHRRIHLLGVDQVGRIGNALQLTAGNEAQHSRPEGSAFAVVRQGNGLVEDV